MHPKGRVWASVGCVLVGVASLWWSQPAHARPGNPERHPVGAANAGMGGVGVAFESSVWHNPAGLGHVAKQGLSASLSLYGLTRERAPNVVDVDAGGRINGPLKSDSIDLFPGSIDYVLPLGKTGSVSHGLGLTFVAPDIEQFDGTLEVPPDNLAFAINLRRFAQTQTFWIMPGWGMCLPDAKFCVGAALAAAANSQKDVSIFSQSIIFVDNTVSDFTASNETNRTAVALGGSLGIQAQPLPGLWLGLSARSSTRTLFSTGSILEIQSVVDDSDPADVQSYVDRVETRDPTIEFKQPWRFAAGIAYLKPGSFGVAFDARFTTGLGPFAILSGPNGEPELFPTLADGTIVNRPIAVQKEMSLDPTANFNLGARWWASDNFILQAGAFTDLSATPTSDILLFNNDRLNRVGATLGAGLVGKRATTWVNLVYSYGWGKTFGLQGANFDDALVDQSSQAIFVMLGATAQLSDEGEEEVVPVAKDEPAAAVFVPEPHVSTPTTPAASQDEGFASTGLSKSAKKQSRKLIACFKQARRRGVLGAGSYVLSLSWEVDLKGRLNAPGILLRGMQADDAFFACVEARMKRWKFPRRSRSEQVKDFSVGPFVLR